MTRETMDQLGIREWISEFGPPIYEVIVAAQDHVPVLALLASATIWAAILVRIVRRNR